MKNILIHTISVFLLLLLTSGCKKSNNDNSLFFPDFSLENPDDQEDPETATSLRVSTYNLWVQSGAAWDQRKSSVAQLIQDSKFEVCGFEEASWEQRSYLGTQLQSEYNVLAYGRDTGGDASNAGEMSGILYHKNRFELLESGRFWYSQTPDVPSSGWDETNFKRFCVWGKFKDTKTDKNFYVFQSHMPLADLARKEACRMLVEKISEMVTDDTPVFCTGDFNATPDAPEIASTIGNSGILKDSYNLAPQKTGPAYTFPSRKTRIDFIFVKDAEVLSTRVIMSPLSDHYPVVIVAEL